MIHNMYAKKYMNIHTSCLKNISDKWGDALGPIVT